jgi:hypothetical protein
MQWNTFNYLRLAFKQLLKKIRLARQHWAMKPKERSFYLQHDVAVIIPASRMLLRLIYCRLMPFGRFSN